MRRIVWLSRKVSVKDENSKTLPAFLTLDAFGEFRLPAAGASASIEISNLDLISIGPNSPPGYYGTEHLRRSVNLAPHLGEIKPLVSPPAGMRLRGYDISEEITFGPWLIFTALLLVLVDTFVSAYLRGLIGLRSLKLSRNVSAGAAIIFGHVLVICPLVVEAQNAISAEEFALSATVRTRLAYVLTGIPEIDEVSRSGLAGLSDVVRRRTAADLGPPLAVDLSRDELAFFPLLYWPVDDRQSILSAEMVRRLNLYLINGGTIIFDTRDQHLGRMAAQGRGLRRLAGGLNIPPLVPVPPHHILTKAFYLMQEFPGRWSNGRVWVEASEDRMNDGVSRVIVGGHDWAAAWSVDEHGRSMFPVVPGGEKQREMAYRFGVNLIIYALTGNYKSDQVHVPAILERLGQ